MVRIKVLDHSFDVLVNRSKVQITRSKVLIDRSIAETSHALR